IVQLLLDRHADIESKDDSGRTALSYAAERESEAIVQLLLDRHADIESKDNSGRTPLSYAAEKGHEAIVQLLLATKGIDVDSGDQYGRTPLTYAMKNAYGTGEIVLMLALGEVDVDINRKECLRVLCATTEDFRKICERLRTADREQEFARFEQLKPKLGRFRLAKQGWIYIHVKGCVASQA
ncbi:ankyrin repeat-containing domain protein, partial [Ilyonectria robusta]|uniref:ankyrin repeat-containing domain protein n=1 Tax=Ilyonectria robusta TaxID=1079257 RepID=UPI001E8CCFFA